MSLPSKSMRSVRALGVPCPRRSHGPVNNGKHFHISLPLSCDDSWYESSGEPCNTDFSWTSLFHVQPAQFFLDKSSKLEIMVYKVIMVKTVKPREPGTS